MAVKIDSGLQITFFSGRKFNPPGARPRVAAQWLQKVKVLCIMVAFGIIQKHQVQEKEKGNKKCENTNCVVSIVKPSQSTGCNIARVENRVPLLSQLSGPASKRMEISRDQK